MRLLFFTILSFITLSVNAQSKDEIINDLEKICTEHCISNSLKNAEIYYNSFEKILDFGNKYNLKTTKITYEFAGTFDDPIHMLQFVREETPNTSTGYFFDSKKSVYQVIDLIYLLSRLE